MGITAANIKALKGLLEVLPAVVDMIQHYKEISNRPDIDIKDKEKAKDILNKLRWKNWEDV